MYPFPPYPVLDIRKEVIYMYGAEFFDFSFWWVCPIIMIALCFFMMRGRKGFTMCGFGSHGTESDKINLSDSARDVLDKRYARGEIGKEEYEEKKLTLNQS